LVAGTAVHLDAQWEKLTGKRTEKLTEKRTAAGTGGVKAGKTGER
jgi:hypothetical protein